MDALPIRVVPSLPAASFADIVHLADALVHVAPEMQIDLVDGQFVPHRSWPFTEPEPLHELPALSAVAACFELEVDCMILEPERYLEDFIAMPVTRMVVHIGSTDAYDEIIAHARRHEYKIGFAITNDRPLEQLLTYIPEIDYVQIMGIKEVGQQGQPFDVRTLDRVRTLREQFPELEIAVDGAVNETTIPQLYAAGVTRFAPGSAIARQPDPRLAYEHLVSLLR